MFRLYLKCSFAYFLYGKCCNFIYSQNNFIKGTGELRALSVGKVCK